MNAEEAVKKLRQHKIECLDPNLRELVEIASIDRVDITSLLLVTLIRQGRFKEIAGNVVSKKESELPADFKVVPKAKAEKMEPTKKKKGFFGK